VKKVIIILCVLSLVFNGCAGIEVKDCKDCSPVCKLAKQDVDSKSKAEGINWGWFIMGAVLLPVGLAVAAIVPIDPPHAAFIGKSPEYVMEYTKCYHESYSLVNFNSAWAGCFTTVMAGLIVGSGVILYFIWLVITTWE
jgi:hypothetical protein